MLVILTTGILHTNSGSYENGQQSNILKIFKVWVSRPSDFNSAIEI
jgi:hypothetical protein